MVTPAQLRAARGMLDWSRKDLSGKCGVPRSTIADYEAGRTVCMLSGNLAKIVEAFGRQGVIFIAGDGVNGSGVRWRKEPS
jgi:transcriptional regulator with XRE-family HTH domain